MRATRQKRGTPYLDPDNFPCEMAATPFAVAAVQAAWHPRIPSSLSLPGTEFGDNILPFTLTYQTETDTIPYDIQGFAPSPLHGDSSGKQEARLPVYLFMTGNGNKRSTTTITSSGLDPFH